MQNPVYIKYMIYKSIVIKDPSSFDCTQSNGIKYFYLIKVVLFAQREMVSNIVND